MNNKIIQNYFAMRFVDLLVLEDVGGHEADAEGEQGEEGSHHANVSEADD